MSTYNVTERYLTDNYAVLQLLTNSEITVGGSITVANVDAVFNGSFTVRALPQYLFKGTDSQGDLVYDYNVPVQNQVLYAKTNANVLRVPSSGTVSYTPVCTWIDWADIAAWLGIATATEADEDFLTICASASSQFAWRRRSEAGYIDSLTTVPSQDVKLGTIMYGGALYRQRGSIDVFASFNEMSSAPITGLSPIIMQLLGINRPQVA
jgi:hypothetical protein